MTRLSSAARLLVLGARLRPRRPWFDLAGPTARRLAKLIQLVQRQAPSQATVRDAATLAAGNVLPHPGRGESGADLGEVRVGGGLPRREDLGRIFAGVDYQMACRTYLWARCRWSPTHRGSTCTTTSSATNDDMVHYVSFQDRLA